MADRPDNVIPLAVVVDNDDQGEEHADTDKPLLEITAANLPSTAYALRDELANSGLLYDRGRLLVRLVRDANGMLYAQPLTPHLVVVVAHEVCQPVKWDRGKQVMTTLPDRVAKMYLESGEWQARPLAGITTAPIMRADGSLVGEQGYDLESEIYSNCTIQVTVPECPTKGEAEKALMALRRTFRTFPFADAVLNRDDKLGVDVVDVEQSPGLDESSYLAAVLTAVARPALWTAPGVIVEAPDISGSGAGKGLLVRAAPMIAYGINPKAFTLGHEQAEFEKRLSSALLTAEQVVFADNINAMVLKSQSLASVMTERPAEVRVFGYTKMMPLNCSAFIGLTGNALRVTEDLARRFLWAHIDPKVEDPESRPFDTGFLSRIRRRRPELLAAALTILRYGRVNAGKLTRGIPMGSFEQWAEWVRDPLIDLGCQDPALGTRQAKAADPRRQQTAELYACWNKRHRQRSG